MFNLSQVAESIPKLQIFADHIIKVVEQIQRNQTLMLENQRLILERQDYIVNKINLLEKENV